jgi:DNA-binding NarL/FixJ family response regulator
MNMSGDSAAPRQKGERVRAIIVDDDPLVRRSVRDSLQEAGIVVIAEASSGREGVELALHYQPDVVVTDMVMPGVDGIGLVKTLADKAPDIKAIVLSVCGDVDIAVGALRAGAAGFLTKGEVEIGALPRVVTAAAEGQIACSREVTAYLVEELRRVPASGVGIRPVRSPLTPREWEILDLLCLDRSTEEMASELFLSHETIRSHIKNIMRKLGVRSRRDAVHAAESLRHGADHTVSAAA